MQFIGFIMPVASLYLPNVSIAWLGSSALSITKLGKQEASKLANTAIPLVPLSVPRTGVIIRVPCQGCPHISHPLTPLWHLTDNT